MSEYLDSIGMTLFLVGILLTVQLSVSNTNLGYSLFYLDSLCMTPPLVRHQSAKLHWINARFTFSKTLQWIHSVTDGGMVTMMRVISRINDSTTTSTTNIASTTTCTTTITTITTTLTALTTKMVTFSLLPTLFPLLDTSRPRAAAQYSRPALHSSWYQTWYLSHAAHV